MLSLADRIRADGRSEGISDGRSEERRELVLQLLARRFGALSPEVEERVARADMDQLKDWAMRLLDARTLDEVFAST
jgi:hypothetical protein